MIIQCFVDFDNTIFPSGHLMPYFHNGTFRFENVPQEIVDQVKAIDLRLTDFIAQHMFFMRVRILTHAGPYWVRAALKLMPYLQRFVDWGYVGLITCGNDTKYTKCYQIIVQEPIPDMFFCCGDSPHDVEAVPQVVDSMLLHRTGDQEKLQVCKVVTCRFIERPEVEQILYQWENIQGRFQTWMHDPRKLAHQSFQVKEEAKRFTLPSPIGQKVNPSDSFELQTRKHQLAVIPEDLSDDEADQTPVLTLDKP